MVSIVQPSKEPSVKQKAHSTNDNQQMAQINNVQRNSAKAP